MEFVTSLSKKELEQISQEISRVKKIEPSAQASKNVLGWPVSYWRDLQRYAPVAVARTIKQPMLVMMGGRDYVAANADLKLWKQLPGTRANVAVKLYPDLNHLFISGKGMATPIEYGISGNVSQQVVRDIVDWVNNQQKSPGLK